MGRSRESKGVILEELKTSLSEAQLTMVIDYQGLTVAEISNLRRKLRPTGTICKVTKNTLMGLAIAEDSGWEPMKSLLSGTSAFLLVKEDIGGAFKAYQEFKKESKKTELRGGVLKEGTKGQLLTEDQIKAIADLLSEKYGVILYPDLQLVEELAQKIYDIFGEKFFIVDKFFS